MKLTTPRRAFALVLMALAVGSSGFAAAQTDAGTQASTKTQAAAPKGDKSVRAMFAFADKNKDGQLTRAEAKGHLPITYKNFDSIDTDKRGWISFDQFVEFTNKRIGKQADDILKIGEWDRL
jgi:Ca2+-binding EF-hand superfamily protein